MLINLLATFVSWMSMRLKPRSQKINRKFWGT